MIKPNAPKTLASLLLALATAAALPAFAQQDNSIVLKVDSGSAMTSTGGEFVSANTGTPLAAGEKIMLNAGATATLVYGNDCKVTFNQPGVYIVPAECHKAWVGQNGSMHGAAIIAGTALIGAAILENMDKTPPAPISGGTRSL